MSVLSSLPHMSIFFFFCFYYVEHMFLLSAKILWIFISSCFPSFMLPPVIRKQRSYKVTLWSLSAVAVVSLTLSLRASQLSQFTCEIQDSSDTEMSEWQFGLVSKCCGFEARAVKQTIVQNEMELLFFHLRWQIIDICLRLVFFVSKYMPHPCINISQTVLVELSLT